MIEKFKIQNSKIKTKFKIKISKLKINTLAFVLCVLGLAITTSYAQEITILYSGDTHAMIYPCNCPLESDGGVSRRATLIKQIRNENPNTILLDAGGFLAGGPNDDYTQNTELDSARSLINLKAMELMRYDAVAVGDDEFNFGVKFLRDNTARTKLDFVSANIKLNGVLPYHIKEVSGIKIGIIGATNPSAKYKTPGVEFINLKSAIKKSLDEAKAKGADIILLLSHLGGAEDLKVLRDIPGIDIAVVAHGRKGGEPLTKVGATLMVRSFWQGRRLGKLTLTLENKKIAKYNVEDLRLSDKVSSDPQVQNILPECFSDIDCKKEGLLGSCKSPGTSESRCNFIQPQKVKLLVITPKSCAACEPERVVKRLKGYFAGIVPSYLYYPDTKAQELIKDLGLRFLPAYIFSQEVENEKGFDNFKANLLKKGDFYIVRPQFCGMSYLVDRNKIKGRVDLVISLYDRYAADILEAIKEFKPAVHFLAIEKDSKFETQHGNRELESYLRAVCVQKYYPEKFFDYIGCQAKNIDSSWWEDCLGNLDTPKIKACSRSPEGLELLRENIRLNQELEIMAGPTYLVDNQEIFSTAGIPTKEEFKKIFNR